MFGRAWRIFSIGGIPVRIDAGLLFFAALIAYNFWISFRFRFPLLRAGETTGLVLLSAFLFFGSILLHELAHAGMARARGLEVEGVTLVLFGGFTSTNLDRDAASEFLVSIVGPLTSLAAGILLWIGSRTDLFSGPVAWTLGYLGIWIGLIAVFNMLPGLPLDGGRVLLAAVWGISRNRSLATRVAAGAGQLVAGALIAGAVYFVIRGNLFGGVWLGYIAMFLFQSARASGKQEEMRIRLAKGVVSDAMAPPPQAVPVGMSLSESLDSHLRGHEQETFPVVDDFGRLVGALTFEAARQVGQHDPLRPVRDAMIPLEDIQTVTENEPLDKAAMSLTHGGGALVVRDGRLVGLLTASDIGQWASARAARQ